MRKSLFSTFLLVMLLCACNPNNVQKSKERQEILSWAKVIAEIELDYLEITEDFYILQRKLGSSLPTYNDLTSLQVMYETISGFYTKTNKMNPPTAASLVHAKFSEKYALASDAILQYYISASQNDILYFEKSVTNSKGANKLNDEAYQGFIEILNKYSITCDEIEFCEE